MAYDIVVVGAGFAGLAAAVRLTASGLRVLVLEAAQAAGGRARSFRDRATGEIVDNGQHLLAGCYRETRAFLKAIGAESRLHLQRSIAAVMIDGGGRVSALECPSLPSPWHLVGALAEWEALGWADRVSALRIARPMIAARAEARGRGALKAASPGETVAQWLERNGQSERIRSMLWEPLALAALNQPAAEAAATSFTAVLGRMFGDEPGDSALGWPTVPLTDFHAAPALAWLEANGSEVRTSARAVAIIEGGRVCAVECRRERIATAAVVLAVPWHQIASAVGGEIGVIGDLLARAAKTAASPIVTVNLWFDRAAIPWPFAGLPGRRFQWVFDRRQMVGDGASHLSMVSSGAVELATWRGDQIVAAAVSELCGALPEARRARLVHATVVRERRATFSLAPGQPARPAAATAAGGLVLAGDWIETGLPGTIEGAVASGNRAAEAVLR